MEYTQEQLKAACALNLCTVSVSQIIDYADVNVMEQEYEAILNNLNLEQIPKDEALLSILKQILDTITFFRIYEKDKEFVDREYQRKVKNAIWSAVPNVGVLVTGGSAAAMAISIASQVGIGYMNYRRAKAEASFEHEKERWALERTAIEQFNGLRRELFDTAWRLSDTYSFPDKLRLTERQISQYDAILMDSNLLRKYDRLDTIKDAFMAYPPFWYNFGNTANAIAQSYPRLDAASRQRFASLARCHFEQYRSLNTHNLLREDPIAAACALELIDLLDFNSDKTLIRELIEEAIVTSGRANDVLQLAVLAYFKLNDLNSAAALLKQLVNEEYNTITNAQMLSGIYVNDFISTRSNASRQSHLLLAAQIGDEFLLPLPNEGIAQIGDAEADFATAQKEILQRKYELVIDAFRHKCAIQFGRIIPVPNETKTYPETYFLPTVDARLARKNDLRRTFASERKRDSYLYRLAESDIPFALLDVLNSTYDASCELAFMTEQKRKMLSIGVAKTIRMKSRHVINLTDKIASGDFSILDAEALVDVTLDTFMSYFFQELQNGAKSYVCCRTEMQDFALAEDNLESFCSNNGLPSVSQLYLEAGLTDAETSLPKRRFTIELFGGDHVTKIDETPAEQKMIDLVKGSIPSIVLSPAYISFFTCDDPQKERYFRKNERLSRDNKLMAETIAILDDPEKKGDVDLIFTTRGVVPVNSGVPRKKATPYSKVTLIDGKTKMLSFDYLAGAFSNQRVSIDSLYELIQKLAKLESAVNAEENSTREEKLFPFGRKNN